MQAANCQSFSEAAKQYHASIFSPLALDTLSASVPMYRVLCQPLSLCPYVLCQPLSLCLCPYVPLYPHVPKLYRHISLDYTFAGFLTTHIFDNVSFTLAQVNGKGTFQDLPNTE